MGVRCEHARTHRLSGREESLVASPGEDSLIRLTSDTAVQTPPAEESTTSVACGLSSGAKCDKCFFNYDQSSARMPHAYKRPAYHVGKYDATETDPQDTTDE